MNTKIPQFIRIISFIWTIFIVAPIMVIMFIILAFFHIANNFTYNNHTRFLMNSEMFTNAGIDIYYYYKFYHLLKIWTLIVLPLFDCVSNIVNALKTIKY